MSASKFQRSRHGPESIQNSHKETGWGNTSSIRKASQISGRRGYRLAEEESDETEYWLELLVEAGLGPQDQIASISKKADGLLPMTVASIKTLRNRKS